MRGLAVVETDDFYKVVSKASAMNAATDSLQPEIAGDRLVTEVIRPEYLQVASVFESVRALISQEGKLVADANLNFLAVTDTAATTSRTSRRSSAGWTGRSRCRSAAATSCSTPRSRRSRRW